MLIYWLPGTEPKSCGKHREFMGFLIRPGNRYPQKHPLQIVAATGHWRMTFYVPLALLIIALPIHAYLDQQTNMLSAPLLTKDGTP
jgi:hypothetical protein